MYQKSGVNCQTQSSWASIATGSQIPISNPFSILQNLDEPNQSDQSNQLNSNTHTNARRLTRTMIIQTYKSNESMLPSSCYLKILQYVNMKARISIQ